MGFGTVSTRSASLPAAWLLRGGAPATAQRLRAQRELRAAAAGAGDAAWTTVAEGVEHLNSKVKSKFDGVVQASRWLVLGFVWYASALPGMIIERVRVVRMWFN